MIETVKLSAEPIDWHGMHRSYLNGGELEIIAALVRSVSARTMIEIGCRDGRTARVLLDNVESLERYVGIDVPLDYQPELPGQRSEIVAEPGFHVRADERFELMVLQHGSLDLEELEPCDAIFIDGDNSRRVVAHDSALAFAAVRRGGIIVWHDYTSIHFDDVTDVLKNLEGAGRRIKHVAGTWLAFCRI